MVTKKQNPDTPQEEIAAPVRTVATSQRGGRDMILKGLQQNAKNLEETGRARVATNFPCVILSFVPDRFKAYFAWEEDEETGRRVRRMVLPERDENGTPIKPEGADEVPTIQVVLAPLDNEGNRMDPVRGFILDTAVRGLPKGIEPVGLVANATGVEVVRRNPNSPKLGEIGHFISGLSISANDNPVIMALAAGAVYSAPRRF